MSKDKVAKPRTAKYTRLVLAAGGWHAKDQISHVKARLGFDLDFAYGNDRGTGRDQSLIDVVTAEGDVVSIKEVTSTSTTIRLTTCNGGDSNGLACFRHLISKGDKPLWVVVLSGTEENLFMRRFDAVRLWRALEGKIIPSGREKGKPYVWFKPDVRHYLSKRNGPVVYDYTSPYIISSQIPAEFWLEDAPVPANGAVIYPY